MIAILKAGVPQAQIDNLIAWLQNQGLKIHISTGDIYTVLGLVGAGGIGAPLIFAMNSYRWNEAGAILAGLIVLVLLVEWISTKIRVKLARG